MNVLIMLEDFLAGHGGLRPGSGRKAEYGERQKPVTVFLSQEHYDFLSIFPDANNVSEAVRLLCERYRHRPLTPRRVKMLKGQDRVHTSITVPDYMRDYLTQLGGDSFVSGVRLLIEMELLKQNR